jgi:alanine-glyoxylate transaminase/serine-glyoxylate transaminase/serine-pyruvate transaminase
VPQGGARGWRQTADRPADPRGGLVAACDRDEGTALQTERAEVFFYAANGHGGWEAVIANLVAAGTSILVPGTGHFSDGWAEQVTAFGGRALRTPYVEGMPIDPAAVETALREDTAHRIAAVFVVHTDTPAGTTPTFGGVRRDRSPGTRPFRRPWSPPAAAPFARWTRPASMSRSGRAERLMLLPGLAFVAADERLGRWPANAGAALTGTGARQRLSTPGAAVRC